jgi:hypothetical protein
MNLHPIAGTQSSHTYLGIFLALRERSSWAISDPNLQQRLASMGPQRGSPVEEELDLCTRVRKICSIRSLGRVKL